MSPSFILLLISALLFDFLNGFHDSANLVATPIASRAISPRKILWLTATAEFVGPFLFGVAVAETIGNDLTSADHITMTVVTVAVLAAIVWNVVTWRLGIPSSSSHALVGGIIGAIAISSGLDAIRSSGLIKIITALFLSPILGLIVGYFLMNLMLFLMRGATPTVNSFFKRAQLGTAIALAFSQGANDAQKTMGIITLGLMIEGTINRFVVPLWVIVVSAAVIAFGTAMGGWKLIKTLGGRIYKIRPIHGFTAQITGATIMLVAAILGGPVSTTQVMSSSIIGVGTAERVSKVRWQVGYEMVLAWMLTIPITAVLAILFFLLSTLIV